MPALANAKGADLREAWLRFVFHGTLPAAFLNGSISGAITTLYVSQHTAAPGESPASGQSTNEAGYSGYARLAVARTAGGWTISDPVASGDWQAVNVAELAWDPKADAGSVSITHIGIGTAASGAGTLLYSGPIGPVVLNQYYALKLVAGELVVKET